MATRQTIFGPLVEVTSAFLNAVQDVFTQRGNGPANSMSTGLDTPNPAVTTRKVYFAMDQPNTVPPLFGGLIDQSQDWRDRTIELDVFFDPVWDIRPGHANDGASPFIHAKTSIYTGIGGSRISLVNGAWSFAIYVDPTNGNLWMQKGLGYMHGSVWSTAQLKERS